MPLSVLRFTSFLLLVAACAPAQKPPLLPDDEPGVAEVRSAAEPGSPTSKRGIDEAPPPMTNAGAGAGAKALSSWKIGSKSVSSVTEWDVLTALDEANAWLRMTKERSGGVHLCEYEGAEYTFTSGAAQYRLFYWVPNPPEVTSKCRPDGKQARDVKVAANAIRVYDEPADVLLVVEPLEGGTKKEAKKLFDAVFKK
jgi:hypothetical protein